jgi:hypothetical protein
MKFFCRIESTVDYFPVQVPPGPLWKVARPCGEVKLNKATFPTGFIAEHEITHVEQDIKIFAIRMHAATAVISYTSETPSCRIHRESKEIQVQPLIFVPKIITIKRT